MKIENFFRSNFLLERRKVDEWDMHRLMENEKDRMRLKFLLLRSR